MATEVCAKVLRDGSCCGEDFLSSTNRTVMWACPDVADGDNPQRTQSGPEDLTKPLYQSVIKKEGSPMVGVAIGMDPGLRSAVEAEDYVSPPKYKSSLLHRYLNDSLRHVMVANAVMDARKRNHSGSFSSNEFDDELLSPSSSEAEAHFVYRAGKETTDSSRNSPTHTTFLMSDLCLLSGRLFSFLQLVHYVQLSVPLQDL